MESEAVKRTFKLNEQVSAVVESVKKKGKYTNRVTLIYENTSDQPSDIQTKKRLVEVVKKIDLEDKQLELVE